MCIASIWSQKVTKTGAFLGMLLGFVGCAVMKIVGAFGISLPIFLDSFFVGLLANIVGLVVGSAVTVVSEKERDFREKLFIMPQSELAAVEIKKTKRTVIYFIGFGVVATISLILLWVVPYYRALY